MSASASPAPSPASASTPASASPKKMKPIKATEATAATRKLKTYAKSKAKKASPAKPTPHPAWKDIIKECIVNSDDKRKGVSRSALKKLNRAIIAGVEAGVFVQPKGPSGCVRLAPKVSSDSNEGSKPVPRTVSKPAKSSSKPKTAVKRLGTTKSTTTKSIKAPANKTVAGKNAVPVAAKKVMSLPTLVGLLLIVAQAATKPRAAPKKLAGKPNAAKAAPKKSSSTVGKAKKAVVGKKAAPAAKAKVARKAPAKRS
ncbi:hypothetical protein B0H14DRAFT_3742607 [Mycena olivaceomarginata]|nr:hypothetical protein B0H14DRAFT_3742607 [Mycena olivaceomarginata]